MIVMLLKTHQIRTDGGTQTRVSTDPDTVEEYADAIAAGCNFPPIVAFRDSAGRYWLADGFHRLAAYIRAGRAVVEVDVRVGELRDAILHAVGSNQRHGLQRTPADKRHCVEIVLRDPEWVAWNDSEVARRCGVSRFLVGTMRAIVQQMHNAPPAPPPPRKVTRGGKTYTYSRTPEPTPAPAPAPPPSQVTRCPTCGQPLLSPA